MGASRERAADARTAVVVSALLGVVTCAPPSLAQVATAAAMLDLPFGLRGSAMGLAGVADRSDPDNIFFNPANVTAVDGVYTTGSYRLYAPRFDNDMWFGHVSAGASHAFGAERSLRVAFDFTLVDLSYGKVMVLDPLTSRGKEYDLDDRYFALTAGIASTLGERFEWAAGAAFKRWTGEYGTIPDRSANMIDLGTVVSTSIDASDWRVRPALGLAAVNVGPDIEFPESGHNALLPSWFNYGVTVRIDAPRVMLGSNEAPAMSAILNVQGDHGLNKQRPLWGFGYELTFLDLVSARWGRRIDDFQRRPIETWGVGLGLPVGPLRARVDYASTRYALVDNPVDVFGVSLAWLFDRRE